jgi:hypothetical protein
MGFATDLPPCPSSGYFHNCFGTYTYAGGGKYVGEFKNDKFNGQGTLTYADGGNKYVGEFKDDLLNGQGTYTYANGDKYVGEHRDGNRHGQGTYADADGTVAEGIWKDGDFQYANKRATNSSSLPDCPSSVDEVWTDCKGRFVTENKNIYVGDFKNDEFSGQGSYTYGPNSDSAGDKYVGDLKDGLFHGQGTYTWSDGDNYVGEFKNDLIHGYGTYTYAEGRKYVGEFQNHKKHGLGTYTWSDGGNYVGEFKHDDQHGYGTYTFGLKSEHAGDVYIGEHKSDKFHGRGFYVFANGDADFCKYVDDVTSNCGGTNIHDVASNLKEKFKNLYDFERKRVQAVLKEKSFYTSKIDGKWNKETFIALASYSVLNLKTVMLNNSTTASKLLSSVLNATVKSIDNEISSLPPCPSSADEVWNNCFGLYRLSNGDIYIGEWKNDEKHGQGTYTYLQGGKYIGGWKKDQKHGQGSLTLSDGDKYIGSFKDNNFTGQGTLTILDGGDFANREEYVGAFKDDEFNGQGTYTVYSNDNIKSVRSGIWKDGKLVENGNAEPAITSQDKTDDNEMISASSGSGFAVSEDGYVVTNHHVIEGCQKVLVHSKEQSVQAIIVTSDPQNDLALLKADFIPETVFPLSADRPELLQDIYVAGYPFGKNISSSVKVTKGIISSLTGIGNNFSNIQIDAALQPGNSGGPILDEKGNVVGVAVAKLDAELILENFGSLPEDTNFGIKSNIVKNILDSNGVDGPQANQDDISKTTLGKMISSGTYYISCWMTMAQIEKMQSEKVMFSNLK